ncbi:MAG: TIGR01212 family radical SAM protein [Paraprevotella sp.]|nr:TIGR01212 family radical SAM protein [Paraprevotella sp.]MCI6743028.1 TIGR01212 family radical SAM protein [Paraprevotella sp.]MDY4615937.1 TIGR01212 family radical SAM protein [Bacteroidaceae bacterium]
MEYKEFGTWLQAELGCKAQKLSVDAGLTCPNRDGTLGRGGCTFCDNRTFNPAYCRQGGSITDQLEAGKRFFARKYPTMKYLAYFQSYSNSYGTLSHLKELYEEALRVPDVVGLVIGTRPDCMPDALLEYLEELNRRTFLLVEYGVESANEETLVRVNRGHTFAQARECIIRTAQRGIRVGVHMILGFPWETRSELIRQAQLIASLPITTLKLHQLQVIKGTQLAREYELHPWPLPTAEEYVDLVLEYISHLPSSLVLERFVSQSPPEYVIAPRWGLKNHEFSALVKKAIQKRSTQLGQ